MKLNSQKKDTRTSVKGLRNKKKVYPPSYVVDLNAEIAKLVSQNDEASKAVEQFDSAFALVRTLIKLRNKTGLSQKQLAEKMGVSQQMVSKLEHIDYEGRTFALLWRHLDALGYRPEIRAVPIATWRKKHPVPGLKE